MTFERAWHRVAVGAAGLTAVLFSTPARATPVLHEFVPPPDQRDRYRWARQGRLPDHIRLEDRLLPRPRLGDLDRRQDHAPRARQRRVHLDRSTGADGELRYRATFDPSVVPFKRVAAFDAVTESFELAVRSTALESVALKRRPTPPNRQAFWGALALRLRTDRAVPLPSVAPTADIVSYRTDAAVHLDFFRDSADNLWVRGDRAGRVRLVFLTDAPSSYFSPELPPLVTSADVPPALRPHVPARVRAAAERVLRHIGVRAGPLRRQLERLVGYFRNFRAGRLERRGENAYLDIALSRRGVCRHRTFAFVVTAQALGIPARYVQNEAHAFAEVFMPRLGWIRVDLGGASTALDVGGAANKTLHRSGPDPFPRPSAYAAGYSVLRGRVRGLSRAANRRSRRARPLRPFDLSSAAARSRPAPSSSTGEPAGAGRSSGGRSPGPAGARPGGRSGAPGSGAGSDRAAGGSADPIALPEEPTRQPTAITVFTSSKSAFRGAPLAVWGRIRSRGKPVRGLGVEIYLSSNAQTGVLLGTTISGEGGRYDATLAIPPDIDVGGYQLFAATPGSSRYRASLSK